jgi:hypothetical protein
MFSGRDLYKIKGKISRKEIDHGTFPVAGSEWSIGQNKVNKQASIVTASLGLWGERPDIRGLQPSY